MAHKIEDFGEKIGGARKDLWKQRGILIEDLTDLTDIEITENVIKENVWPTPDWKSMTSRTPEVLYIMRYIREKTPGKPKYAPGRSIRMEAENYIKFVAGMRDFVNKKFTRLYQAKRFSVRHALYCGFAKVTYGETTYTHNDNFDEIDEDVFINGRIRWDYESGEVEGMWQYLDQTVNKLNFNESGIEAMSWEARIQHFPDEFRGDLKGYTIRRSPYRASGNGYILYKSGTQAKFQPFDSPVCDTPEEILQWCDENIRNKLDAIADVRGATSSGKTIKVVRPQLDRVVRTCGNVRERHNCSGEQLMRVFKFRGGEFGNWNNDSDRQNCLNYAFDAFIDLSYILDLPLEAMSLGFDRYGDHSLGDYD